MANPPTDGAHAPIARDIRAIAEAAAVSVQHSGSAAVAVLDGTYLAVSDTGTTENGDPLNTLWGVMAHQLGGQEAYNIIGNAARDGTAPGGAQLDQLLSHVGPSLILMDELVAYARNTSAAHRERIYTFIQALTQSVRRSRTTALVVTLPESSLETGGDIGDEVLNRLENILGRSEAVWEPLAVDEAFEVVRRRLFGQGTDDRERDRTCEAFASMYGHNRREYPTHVVEHRYLERMKACYPIHPEIFDRLYADWSSIPRFQRTRGVLRMMSTCVSRLYREQNSAPLIMPGDLPLSDPHLASEFDQLLPGNWGPVLHEIDSDSGRADRVDSTSQRFQEVGGAARRVARAIFLGSATSGATRGIDQRSIHLAVAWPGHGVPRYNEALGRMVGNLYYLYNADNRYYFHAEENLNKVAADRKDTLAPRIVDGKIITELKNAIGRRSDVIVCPPDSAVVPEADATRIIVLSLDQTLSNRASEPDNARSAALAFLQQRGDTRRIKRNTLLFLAARKDEIRVLRDATRTLIAWQSINSGYEDSGYEAISNLTGERRKQVNSSLRTAETAFRNALVRAYRWAMAPSQTDPQQADAYAMNVWQTETASQANPGDIIKSALATFRQEEALLDSITPSALDGTLAKYYWDKNDHISVKALWDALTSNVYLFRLLNRTALEKCIIDGVAEERFGYAERYEDNEYQGSFCFGKTMDDGNVPWAGLLVNPVMAGLERERREKIEPSIKPPDPPDGDDIEDPPPGPAPDPTRTRRVVVRKTLTSDITTYDFNQVRNEIIRNLHEEGGNVTVEVTITADNTEGFSDSIIRAVRDNSNLLGLDFTDSENSQE